MIDPKKARKYLKEFKNRIKQGDTTVPKYGEWLKRRNKTRRTRQVNSALKNAGIDWNKDKPSARR